MTINSFILAAAMVVPFSLGLAFSAGGCDNAIDHIFDCNQICQRYSDCIDADYDVSACANECEDKAGDSEDYADKADDCETCLDDRSCAGSFPCIDECAGIVP